MTADALDEGPRTLMTIIGVLLALALLVMGLDAYIPSPKAPKPVAPAYCLKEGSSTFAPCVRVRGESEA